MEKKWVVIGLFFLTLFGFSCNHGSGSLFVFPEVITVSPQNGAANVTVNAQIIDISGHFDVPMDPSTIDTNSFKVSDANGNIAGTVDYNESSKKAIFTPSTDLQPGTTYTAIITSDVEDITGKHLDSSKQWTFTTQSQAFGAPQLVEANSLNADKPQIAINEDGDAFAVWVQDSNIRSNRFDGLNLSWSNPVDVETETLPAKDPQIAIDDVGNAFAVWDQNNGSIFANRFNNSTQSWQVAEEIDTLSVAAEKPQSAFRSDGDGIAAWTQGSEVFASLYEAGNDSWQSPVAIEANLGNAQDIQVGFDEDGNAIVIWVEDLDLWANVYSSSNSNWGTATILDTDTPVVSNPQIAMNGGGNAVVVWQQSDGLHARVHSVTYQNSSWSSPVMVDDGTGDSAAPQITVNPSGVAFAVWQERTDTNSDGVVDSADLYSVFANRMTIGQAWETPQLLENDNGGDATNPQIASDGSGNAIAVWEQSDSTVINIWVARFTAVGGWMPVQPLESSNATASNPQIAMNVQGQALIVWQQSDGSDISIWASVFN